MDGEAIMINGDVEKYTGVDDSIWPVQIEVRLVQHTSQSFSRIKKLVHQDLIDSYEKLLSPSVLESWKKVPILRDNVERIAVSESASSHHVLPTEKCSLQIHVYRLSEDETVEKMATNPSDESEEYSAGSTSSLPSRELEGLWESLFYDGDVKTRLLNYIYATIGFSDAGVDHNLVSWNRVILLHGPPGTGKTSLCRALAQKLSIRLKDRYSKTHLFEINSHSLFSRWFSESGKLVQNLFSTVNEMTREEDEFVVLLIDEVESLTSARSNAISGNEPSDALRVVNALLTQIDRLKYQKNVLIMATSNLAKAIDTAFVDRADVIQYIDFPPPEAIYDIMRSSLLELMGKGIIENLVVPLSGEAVFMSKSVMNYDHDEQDLSETKALNRSFRRSTLDRSELSRYLGARLFAVAEKCKGVSGRSLRRLPVLAHARYIGIMPMPRAVNDNHRDNHRNQVDGLTITKIPPVSIDVWLDAMRKVVIDETQSRQRFQC